MRLVLPLPPSPNKRSSHWAVEQRAKNEYRAACWIQAVKQAMPRAIEDLPAKVIVQATFYLRNRRDEADNLPGSLKWTLDTLKAKQTGKLDWRQGLYETKGFLIDDGPDHCEALPPTQYLDRKEPRVELEILEAA